MTCSLTVFIPFRSAYRAKAYGTSPNPASCPCPFRAATSLRASEQLTAECERAAHSRVREGGPRTRQ
jgi:hypothetical protein